MRILLVCVIVVMLALLQACGGDGDQFDPSPTSVGAGEPSQPAPTATRVGPEEESGAIIAFTKQYRVTQTVQLEDGRSKIELVSLAERVDLFCSNTPRWYTRDAGSVWHVLAECQKEEAVPGDNTLKFDWIYYPNTDFLEPLNLAAHVAHSQYPWEP